MPLITVITVVLNNAKSLEKTILSVINQTYKNVEYIIIDGASTDNTLEIIKKYENKIDYWLSEPDDGLYYAMNKGIDFAAGDWINFMNSGDIFTDNSVLEKIFNNHTFGGIDIIYGNSTEKQGTLLTEKIPKTGIKGLNKEPVYRHNASFIRSDVHREYKFDVEKAPLIGFGLDFDCIYRLYKAGKCFYYMDVNVVIYEKEGISDDRLKCLKCNYLITKNGFNLLRWTEFRLRQLVNILRKLYKK
jgi:glycosyltransferase involved in cell wall biosynthesis